MKKYEHTPRKRFSQNFLTDDNIIRKIVAAFSPKENDHVVEIGPGQGALTTELFSYIKKFTAIEKDRDLIPLLQEKCEPLGQLTLHEGNVLKFNFEELVKGDEKLRLIGNLPYNISSPLLFHVLSYSSIVQDMVFMLQKEVVDRICATEKTHAYGRLTIMIGYYCKSEALFTVPASAFYPKPKVESKIIHLTPYDKPPYIAKDVNCFEEVVRQAFNQRRKTLRNSLGKMISEEGLEALGINPMSRAEVLSIKDYVNIANAVSN